ncbi:MAG: S1 RNA-binding domain-containing protein, partial [Candidatus Methanofastidiosia archaeon]
GMVHIREISSSWVKNIRNHVKENQKIVCKVLRIDESKRHIDLSLRRVTNQQKKTTITRFKVKRKGNKLLEYFGKQNGISPEQLTEIRKKILEKYLLVYDCFEEVVASGKEAMDGLIPPECIDSLYDIIVANIESPFVEVSGEMSVSCHLGNGVNVIRDALVNARNKNTTEDVGVDIRLLGSPRYSVKIIASDYKTAETVLENVNKEVMKTIKAHGGETIFKRNKQR